MTRGPHDDDRADDDLIAVVRAGLQELQPAVTNRVDHHRFWRDGQRRRQRRTTFVATSVVVTLAAVLVPLILVALPDDRGGPAVLAPPVTSHAVATHAVATHAVATHAVVSLLTTQTLAAALRAAAPTAGVTTADRPAAGASVLGRSVITHVQGLVLLGSGVSRISLQINAFRLSSPLSDDDVLAYLKQASSSADVGVGRAGTGSYVLPSAGWDGFAGLRTGEGTFVLITGDSPVGGSGVAGIRRLTLNIAAGLSRSSL